MRCMCAIPPSRMRRTNASPHSPAPSRKDRDLSEVPLAQRRQAAGRIRPPVPRSKPSHCRSVRQRRLHSERNREPFWSALRAGQPHRSRSQRSTRQDLTPGAPSLLGRRIPRPGRRGDDSPRLVPLRASSGRGAFRGWRIARRIVGTAHAHLDGWPSRANHTALHRLCFPRHAGRRIGSWRGRYWEN